MVFRQKSPDETDGGLFIREDSDHPFPSPDFFVKALLGVAGAKSGPVFPRERQDGQCFLEPFLEAIHGLGSLLLEALEDLVPDRPGFLFRVGPEELRKSQRQGSSLGGRRMTQKIAEKVHLTALPPDPLKMFLNGLFESFVVIRHAQLHSGKSSPLEALQHALPGRFIFAVPQDQSQDSRWPSPVIPVAIRAAIGTTLSSFLTRITRASIRTIG